MAFRADYSISAALVLLLVLLLNFITLLVTVKVHSFGPPNTRSSRRDHHPPEATKIHLPPNTHYAVPPPPTWRHDVFLSFRGLDVRYTIADYLYYALVRKGIKAFHDDRDLPRGENITEAIPRAIEESRMSIVVLSKGYASSEWCLDELVKIMEAAKDNRVHHHQTFPIFYGVSPDEVSDQSSGCYKNDFDLHKRKFSYERVDNWRHALTSIADVSGWVFRPNDHRSEAEMVETIANSIYEKLQQLDRRYGSDSIGRVRREREFSKPDEHPSTEGESNQNERHEFVPADFRVPEGALDDETPSSSSSSSIIGDNGEVELECRQLSNPDELEASQQPKDDNITGDQRHEEEEEQAASKDEDYQDEDSDNYKRRLWMSRSCKASGCNNKNDPTHDGDHENEHKLKDIKLIISRQGQKIVEIPKTVTQEEIKRRPDVQLDWSTIPMWIRPVGIPVAHITAKGLSNIASALGKPVYMDRATATQSQLALAKVCVEIMKLIEERSTSTIVVAIGVEDNYNEEGGGEVVVLVVRVFYQWRSSCMGIINPSHKATTTSTTSSS